MFHKTFDVVLDPGMVTEFILMQVTEMWFTWKPEEKDNRPILKEGKTVRCIQKLQPWTVKDMPKMLVSCHR